MMKVFPALLILAATCLAGCATGNGASAPYAVLNPDWIRNSLPGGGPGTKWGDYRWAAASPTFGEAVVRWETVLRKHDVESGEDGLDFNMWLGARQELMRAYYATGRTAEADIILRELRKYW
jgi:hypothetical protein